MISIQGFDGSYPIIPPHLLPDNAAQQALNCDVRFGNLKPLPATTSVSIPFPTGTKGVFTKDGLNFITATSPLRAFLSPTTDDTYGRVYGTTDSGFYVTQWGFAKYDGSAVTYWRVGIPEPTVAITVEKVNKNRWPNVPNTTMKAKFFLESNGQRYQETAVTLTAAGGSSTFSKYTFDSGINITATAQASAVTEDYVVAPSSLAVNISSVYTTTATTLNGQTTNANAWTVINTTGYMAVEIYYDGAWKLAYIGTTSVFVTATSVTKVMGLDGKVYVLSGTAGTGSGGSATPTTTPSSAVPCVELWLENNDHANERLWTAYTNNTSSGSVLSFPGGADITLTPTGNTTYEIDITYGVIETRSYVYTLVNDWEEESVPSLPIVTSVTYLNDVILRVDKDACATLLTNFNGRPLKRIQFYVATSNGVYEAIKTAPVTSANDARSVTDLFHTILFREPTTAELAYWTAAYNAGTSISDIAHSLTQLPEAMDSLVVLYIQDMYSLMLHTTATDAQVSSICNSYNSGALSVKQFVLNLMTDTAFIAYYGDLLSMTPNTTNINSVFQALLGRNADSTTSAWWIDKISTDKTLWAELIKDIILSDEYKQLRERTWVTLVLTKTLGTTPTTAQINAGVAKINAGGSYNSLAETTGSITTDGYVDESARAGWTLLSATWNPPVADLHMLTQLPNGVFAAVSGRYVYFSEPYLPFAWPADYVQTIPYDIIGIMAYEGQVLVVHKNGALVISGAHPSAMTQRAIGSSEAGVAEYAMTIVDGQPMYATVDGLMTISGLTASLEFSRHFISSESWRTYAAGRLSTLKLLAHDGRVIGLWDSGDGFIVNYRASKPHIVDFAQLGGYPVQVPGDVSLYLLTATGPVKLFSGSDMTYSWRSKEFTLPMQTNFGYGKIIHNGSVTLKIYGDGTLLYTTPTFTSTGWKETFFRLPGDVRYLRLSVLATGTAVVEQIALANSALELRNGG